MLIHLSSFSSEERTTEEESRQQLSKVEMDRDAHQWVSNQGPTGPAYDVASIVCLCFSFPKDALPSLKDVFKKKILCIGKKI